MKRFHHYQEFSTFNQKKLSANAANTQYTVGVSGTVTNGTPDIAYQCVAFIKDTKQIWTHGQLYGSADVDMCVNVTYNELVNLVNTKQLVPGQQYRITNYMCYAASSEYTSAANSFDIIVVADDVDKLNENARATHHKGGTRFANCDLSAWELKYSLFNDTDRFPWANTLDGRGVIYYMKDEWNNECGYDFKNIKFRRYKIEQTADNYLNVNGGYGIDNSDVGYQVRQYETEYFYTFTDPVTDDDATLDGYSRENVIKSIPGGLPNNVFLHRAYCNVLEGGSDGNTFNSITENNVFGPMFKRNTFAYECSNNVFGVECLSNVFAGMWLGNKVANRFVSNMVAFCENNVFGSNVESNRFRGETIDNVIAGNCNYNVIDGEFQFNDIGGGFAYVTAKGAFIANTTKYAFSDCRIEGECTMNVFSDVFLGNILDGMFMGNVIGAGCYSTVFNHFIYNNIGMMCTGCQFPMYVTKCTFGSNLMDVDFYCQDTMSEEYCPCGYNVLSNISYTNVKLTSRPVSACGAEITIGVDSEGNVKQWCVADLISALNIVE